MPIARIECKRTCTEIMPISADPRVDEKRVSISAIIVFHKNVMVKNVKIMAYEKTRSLYPLEMLAEWRINFAMQGSARYIDERMTTLNTVIVK